VATAKEIQPTSHISGAASFHDGFCCCGTTLPFIFAFAHFKSFSLSGAELNLMRSWFFFKGPVAKLCPPDRAAKQGEKLEE